MALLESASLAASLYGWSLLGSFVETTAALGIGQTYWKLVTMIGSVLAFRTSSFITYWCINRLGVKVKGDALAKKLTAGKSFVAAWNEANTYFDDYFVSIWSALWTFLSIIGAMVVIGLSSWEMATVAVIGFVFAYLFSWFQNKSISKANQGILDVRNVLKSLISLFERNYRTSSTKGEDTFFVANDPSLRLANLEKKNLKAISVRDGIVSLVGGLTYVGLLVASALLIYYGVSGIGSLVTAAALAGTIYYQVGYLTKDIANVRNNRWITNINDVPPSFHTTPTTSPYKTGTITLEEVSLKIDGKWALFPVSAVIHEGCNVLLKGPNGSGKTTLARIIVGLIDEHGGQLTHGGVSGLKYDSLPVCYQTSITQLLPGTVKENITAFGTAIDEAKLAEIVNALGIGYLLPRQVKGLSAGEAALTKIAYMLQSDSSIRVYDEVFVNVDEQRRSDVINYCLSRGSINIVIAHHELNHSFDQTIELPRHKKESH